MVLEVCGSAVQLVCAPARSLWPTLASAASTLALIGTANWGLNFFLEEENFVRHLVKHIIVALGMPLTPILFSLTTAFNVWRIKRCIHIQKRAVPAAGSVKVNIEKGSISILSSCPLYLQFPSSALPSTETETETENERLRTRGYKLVADPRNLCPMEWAPATIGSTDHRQLQDMSAAQADDQNKYIQFADIYERTDVLYDGMQEREVVLRLGIAPEYRQLRFLRSRSRFQAVVTTLQAGGYLLSVGQRLAQHLAVCPLEALLCFLSVIIMLQLLVELYSCCHFQRPLLLRLNHHQFSQFWCAPRLDVTQFSSMSNYDFRLVSLFTVAGVLGLPFSALSMYYAVHYMQSCLVCSLAALFLLFALLLWIIGGWMVGHIQRDTLGLAMVVFSAVIFASSMVLAVVSTATDWELFHSPTNNSFSWILPHVSSEA